MAPKTGNYTALQPPPTDSDGAQHLYPENIQGMPKATADNFFREVQPHERKHVLYRTESARKLIETFGNGNDDTGNQYMLEDFPKYYRLFEHNKRQANGKFRTDHYLFGHPTGQRFRSVPEFLPHLLHLAAKGDPAVANHPKAKDYLICSCAYCSRGSRSSGGSRVINKVSHTAADRAKAQKEVAAEERLGEQEMAGWVFRKGEIVWVWIGAADEDQDLSEYSTTNWCAGVVLQKPSVNTALQRPETGKGAFASINANAKAPWEEGKDDWYCIQLLSDEPDPSDVLDKVPQWHLRPWLSRSSSPHPKEHPSIPIARNAVKSFSLFEPLELYPANEERPYPRQTWGGLFLGAEKIFVNEPVRILNFSNPDIEDVMVVDHIYSETRPSSTSEGKTTTITMLRGSVYTSEPGLGAVEIGPQQFAVLPFRMRRGTKDGTTITWHTRNASTERGELAVKYILGRWYEPVANYVWGGVLERCQIKHMTRNRADTPGFEGVYGNNNNYLEATDKRTPQKASLANNAPETAGKRTPASSAAGSNTPARGFRSINVPSGGGGSTGKSKMALAVEDDQEEEEEEEGDDGDEVKEIDPAVFAKSPTKRLVYR